MNIFETSSYAERRQSPRFEFIKDVDLVLENGEMFTVSTKNISNNGINVLCDSWVTDAIEPRGIQIHATNHIRFKIVTELPVKGKGKKLYASCRIKSLQRLSQDEYMLNLEFISFENGSDILLDRFTRELESQDK